MVSPNHFVAEDRDNEPNSAPKRLLQGPEGDGAGASLDMLRGDWRRLYRCEPRESVAIFSFAGSPIGARSLSTVGSVRRPAANSRHWRRCSGQRAGWVQILASL
jgi:hypothetical protein